MRKRYEVSELEKLIEAKHTNIRWIQHIQSDKDTYYSSTRANLTHSIEGLVAQVQALDAARAHGGVVIDRYKRDIIRLQGELKLASHRQLIERLLRIREKADALQT